MSLALIWCSIPYIQPEECYRPVEKVALGRLMERLDGMPAMGVVHMLGKTKTFKRGFGAAPRGAPLACGGVRPGRRGEKAVASPILSRMSRPRIAALCRATPCCEPLRQAATACWGQPPALRAGNGRRRRQAAMGRGVKRASKGRLICLYPTLSRSAEHFLERILLPCHFSPPKLTLKTNRIC